ncbi:MAG: hypothetical protein ACD_81C00176G0003 [uncultured bacterium]|uniref:Phage-related replication protein n=2 Tax=Candidatus Wolfeibacteriota TaxID=1752735 RepID=A0A0G1HBJ7_9BACT|nr:MAG: hypothetical protein ACD_81C00176G0003 [uncultured bacterium]KKR12976.1 MAG: Phage-related replication protein [Candidatus Wolfebacteria bacterium GW2011_GWC2_39_22]KKT43903.1 MAG: Phage-related replication protein [Candidatus Wolfebacteria bacterium GW2011_GWE2_44_13]
MIDTYRAFEDLAAHMQEGQDYRIVTKKRNSPYLIAGIHGGRIEPFTSNIAESIAGEEYDVYLFEGIREKDNAQLHITSAYFNEPQALDMVRVAEIVIAIHGKHDTEDEFVMVGGLCEKLVQQIQEQLRAVDITIKPFDERMHPESFENICNRGMSGGGVELEISRKLRDALQEDEGLYRLFINAIRRAIAGYYNN